MGGLSSVASAAVQALSFANTVAGGVDKYQKDSGRQAYAQNKQLAALELRNAQDKAALDKQAVALSADAADAARRDALRRAIARQKASYGASGIDQSDGSSQAVLLGLTGEAAEDQQREDSLNALKSAAADQSVLSQQRVNTLKLTQEKERNKLSGITSAYSAASSLI